MRLKQKNSWPPRCHICNKYMSYKQMVEQSISWVPYGGYFDSEPPNEEYAHIDCWKNYENKDLIEETSWIKPQTNCCNNKE